MQKKLANSSDVKSVLYLLKRQAIQTFLFLSSLTRNYTATLPCVHPTTTLKKTLTYIQQYRSGLCQRNRRKNVVEKKS